MIVPIDRDQRDRHARISGDRRDACRYDLRLNLKWKLVRRRRVLDQGEGYTLDISSSGMMLEAGKPLPVSLHLELSISWPVLLHSVSPLQLAVSGRIVRSENGRTAIRIACYEFRTVGAASERQKLLATRSAQGVAAYTTLPNGMPLRTIH